MPSPDLTDYVDLTLFDLDAQTIFEQSQLLMANRLPEYLPRETNIEMILAEAIAYQIEQLVFTINRLPGTIFDILMRRFNIERDLGTPPLVDLVFTMSDNLGHEVPLGTRAILNVDGVAISFRTTSGVVIPAGSTVSAPVGAIGEDFTNFFNGTVSGTVLQLVDAIPYVERVVTSGLVGGGYDEETEAEWRARGAARFGRLTETLVMPTHFVAAALESTIVQRAFGIDNYDPGGPGAPGTVAGHQTVAVYGDNAPLTAGEKAGLEVTLNDSAAGNLAVHVVDPTITEVDVTVTVRAIGGYPLDWVEAGVIDILRNYMSTAVWPWNGVVRRNELIALIDRANGVDWVEELTIPAADTVLPGYAPLAVAGDITVTVNPAVGL
jgi:uncharacterized phage protein gp47/JayE